MIKQNKNDIKQFDIVYFVLYTLFWLVIDRFLVAIRAGRIALLVIFIYTFWYVFGPIILLIIQRTLHTLTE